MSLIQRANAWRSLVFLVAIGVVAGGFLFAAPDDRQITLIVTDPLAAPLSCPCVAGYAQRDYEKLATFLSAAIGCDVKIIFTESLRVAGRRITPVDVVIGKSSVVKAEWQEDRKANDGVDLLPVAQLTDLEGSSWQHGLIVVSRDDAAQTLADLGGHVIYLGPPHCDEKNVAARDLLSQHGVTVPATTAVASACSDGAEKVITAAKRGAAPAATVISSYAQPLLEGCGTIRRGDLRVIGKTRNVPFITAFVASDVARPLREKITKALLSVVDEPLLRLALETRDGFVSLAKPPVAPNATPGNQQSDAASPEAGKRSGNGDWPGWRGPLRDGRVGWLPTALPAEPRWRKTLFSDGVGGIAVAEGIVVVGDRDLADEQDVFHAFDAQTGDRLWSLEYSASGHLDYGNSPRATPLLVNGRVYLLGAFGHLHCCRITDGAVEWRRHLRDDFGVRDELVWGVASSPLIVDDQLIVNPGGPDASVVSLSPANGNLIWKTAGEPAAFASFVMGRLQGRRQLIGLDKVSCGGWDPATGERLWTYVPGVQGDFNVPTPIVLRDQLLLVSENNAARLVGFADGKPFVKAQFTKLRPDMHTPVMTSGRIFAVHDGWVYCLSADTLAPLWSAFDRSLKGHVSLIASETRVLLQTQQGELVLIDALADALTILSRSSPLRRGASTYAHPAVAADAIYVRGPGQLACLSLEAVGETAAPLQ